MGKLCSAFLMMAAGIAMATQAQAAVIGQIDTFEDGTTQGWTVAVGPNGGVVPSPPTNIATGGPGGVDDNYLRLTSSGAPGAGGRLTALNFSQWAGDYLAAGIGAIEMDVRNFGNTDLALRLYFENPVMAPPTHSAFSSNAITLVAGSGWTHVVFPIAPSDLTAGIGNVNDALAQVTIMRILHGAAAAVPGEPIAGLLGIDNIRALAAVPVPEPATMSLLASGLAAAASARALRRRPRAQRPAAWVRP